MTASLVDKPRTLWGRSMGFQGGSENSLPLAPGTLSGLEATDRALQVVREFLKLPCRGGRLLDGAVVLARHRGDGFYAAGDFVADAVLFHGGVGNGIQPLTDLDDGAAGFAGGGRDRFEGILTRRQMGETIVDRALHGFR